MGPDVGAASRMGHEGFAARTPLLSPCSEKGLGLWGGREGRRSRMPCRAVPCCAVQQTCCNRPGDCSYTQNSPRMLGMCEAGGAHGREGDWGG